MEAYDATPYNATLFKQDGGVVALPLTLGIPFNACTPRPQRMIRYGATEQEVFEMITLGPCKMLGIEDKVGTLTVGKDADLALFSHHPLDVYTRVSAHG